MAKQQTPIPDPNKKSEVEVNMVVEESSSENMAATPGASKFLSISILVAAVLICATLIYVFGPSKGLTTQSTVTTQQGSATTSIVWPNFPTTLPYQQTREGNEVVLGNPKAPVQLVQFGDYQCSFCNMYFNQTEPQIRQDYVATGKVNVVFKNLIVIDNFVPGSKESYDSALAASCAMDQNEFWQYHDALYMFKTVNPGENAGDLTPAVFDQIATDLGMNLTQFESCYNSQKYASLLTSDMQEAAANNFQATPSFLINGTPLQGAEPFADFQAAINAALAATTTKS